MEIKNKKIDVIIPVYNGEKYILDSIKSVIQQSFLPNKIIIVDDGSTDKTVEIVTKFSSTSPIDIEIIKQKNKGVSSARNVGIKKSQADFIALLDSDDIWLPNKLFSQINIFKESNVEDLGLVYCSLELINNKSEKEEIRKKNSLINLSNKGSGALRKNIDKNIITSSASGVLIKRKCFLEVGLFDESLTAFEDWDMWLRITEEYGIDYSNNVHVKIRSHNTNMQKNHKHILSNQIKFYKKWFSTALLVRPHIIFFWFYRLLKSFLKCVISKEEPKVSIIMPVYNGEKYIVETLDSLICQSKFIKELIIVNDSSTDNTCTVIEKFKKEKDTSNIIKLLDNKFEKGISGSLNTGIDISTGEYIARADGDDLYKKNRILKQVKILNKRVDIDIVGSSFIVFGENVKRKLVFRPLFSVLTAFNMVSDMSLCHPIVMFRRSVLKSFPKYPNSKAEDFSFFSSVLRKHRAINLLEPLINYRRHKDAYSINLLKNNSIKIEVDNIFKRNYIYYTKNDDEIEVFYLFSKKRIITKNNFKILFKINNNILVKIKKNYKMKYCSVDFICSVLYIYLSMIVFVFRKK